MVTTYYDSVLIHSDKTFTPLETSWPVSPMLRTKLNYTGYVTPPAAGLHPEQAGEGEVIVSAGGGDVGGPVYETALAAAPHIKRPMRILVGGAHPDERIDTLRKTAPLNVSVEAARPDFRQMLHHAAASVSLCAYNTALDILKAGTPAVFVLFDEGDEVEQGLRASALAAQDGIAVLTRAEMTAESLCTEINAVIAASRRTRSDARFDGRHRRSPSPMRSGERDENRLVSS